MQILFIIERKVLFFYCIHVKLGSRIVNDINEVLYSKRKHMLLVIVTF